jgi:hypothetical protein
MSAAAARSVGVQLVQPLGAEARQQTVKKTTTTAKLSFSPCSCRIELIVTGLKAFIDEKGTIIPEGAVQLPSLPCPSKIQMAMIFAHF